MSRRSTQPRTTEECRKSGRRIEPGCPAIRRPQSTTYVITRFAIPGCHHILIGAILDNLDIGYPVEIADFIHLRPCLSGISAAPDGPLEAGNSEIGSPEQDEVRIVTTKAHGIKVR